MLDVAQNLLENPEVRLHLRPGHVKCLALTRNLSFPPLIGTATTLSGGGGSMALGNWSVGWSQHGLQEQMGLGREQLLSQRPRLQLALSQQG